MSIELSFLGAAQNVTGSRFLLQANGNRILIDCGLYQEREFRERNWNPFPVPPQSIDAVLLTHAHLDHCGYLPKLVKDGFTGKIYCTAATSEITKIILLDSAHIQEEDARYKRKRHRREGRKGKYPVVPLYTGEDVEACFDLFAPLAYEQTQQIAPGIQARFRDAGHILGASMIEVKINGNAQERTILFSGDVGRQDKPILQDPSFFDHADYVLVESTYGDRVHQATDSIKPDLEKVINSTHRAGGNIIVPSFAVERSQEVLYYLNELLIEKRIPRLAVVMDSPMAIKVTEVFEQHPELFDEEMLQRLRQESSPFDLPDLQMSRTTNQSKAINRIKGPTLIIAGSGMCTGGRVKHHLVHNISKAKCCILFVGYQAKGTLGRHIVDGAKEVRILGRNYHVKARIVQITGFSAHADRDELTKWLSALQKAPRRLFIVHGEADSANSFAEHIKKEKGWEVTVPTYEQKVLLD